MNTDESDIFVAVKELNEKHGLWSKLNQLRQFYYNEFDTQPEFFVRVPGRVNLIGEHVDYCGYPVLPMAIDQCIMLAVGATSSNSLLQLCNADKAKFDSFKCDLKTINIELTQSIAPEWYKYYLCGIKGIFDTLEPAKILETPGMMIALSGNIPTAAGLSSSSALVSAAVLATAHLQGIALQRKRLAAISASCERYIGTQGGGMDQAIAYLAKMGCAQFIEFYPELSATSIELPEGACFVVANSLADKNKAASSDFNERVVECRLAARFIAKRMNLPNWRDLLRLAELQSVLQCSLSDLEQLTLECLPNNVYTREELCVALQVSEQQFENEFLTANTQHMQRFKLQQRALHVLRESLRVCSFRDACQRNSETVVTANPSEERTKQLATLSKLMRQSHQSLLELYECSHPDLDRLIAISDEVNVGARLTGAGWGGCIVALCNSKQSTREYIQNLKDKYFSQLPAHILEKHQHNDFQQLVFATYPGSGAEIFTLPTNAASKMEYFKKEYCNVL